jgi:hypothetical protein
MLNLPIVQFLTASIIAAVIGISGLALTSQSEAETDIYITPMHSLTKVGDTITVSVVASSKAPVNVFKGFLRFDPRILSVAAIDYNTSIADLWAEEPWYSNGDGTINFIGGTTKLDGFSGEGTLITITFTAISIGESHLSLDEARILKHDGLGTETALGQPLDAIFATEAPTLEKETVFDSPTLGPTLTIVETLPDRDLNDDGKQTVADVSIFMVDFATKNLRSDLNGDQKVDLQDLSILTR